MQVTQKPLLSRPEQVLYGRLVRAFPGYVIFTQIALSQILTVDRADVPGGSASIANRQLIAEFVLCTADFLVTAVIELDDRLPRREPRRGKDQRKYQLLADAGIKVIRVPADDIPNESALKALAAVGPATTPSMRRTG
jgi:hypothetical protein